MKVLYSVFTVTYLRILHCYSNIAIVIIITANTIKYIKDDGDMMMLQACATSLRLIPSSASHRANGNGKSVCRED